MPDPTTNHGYDRPDFGTVNWHLPLNENFDQLDRDAEIRDVETNRDQYDPRQGAKFLATDTGAVYLGDGTQWNFLGEIVPEQTGGGGAELGPYGKTLVGSADLENPRGGLHTEVETALNESPPKSILNIVGAWDMETGAVFSSASDTASGSGNRRAPLVIDANGAVVRFLGGSGTAAFENDNTGNIAGQIEGGVMLLYGGVWVAESGGVFVRGIDMGGNRFYPTRTRNFDVAYQLVIGSKWCESNIFSGKHHTVGTGIEDVTGPGNSFQDNYAYNLHLGAVRNYGFDLTGNWIDCKFEKVTVIVDENNTAALRYNANLGGTSFDNLEIENAGSGATDIHVVEIGPDVRVPGPTFHDMNNQLLIDKGDLGWIDASNAGGPWTVWMSELNSGSRYEYRFKGDSSGFGIQQRMTWDGGGFRREEGPSPAGPWTTVGTL